MKWENIRFAIGIIISGAIGSFLTRILISKGV